ncbi:MAG: hypothetical protein AAFX87_16865 [Bacteroidota bacterium]
MRGFEYLLKYTFAAGFSIAFLFILGPDLIGYGLGSDAEEMTEVQLSKFEVSFLDEHTTRYVKLNATLNGEDHRFIYFVPEGEHNGLLKCLHEYQLGNLTEPLDLPSILPIKLSKTEINDLPPVSLAMNEDGFIERVKIGEIFVAGEPKGAIQRTLALIMGVLLMIVIAILFIMINWVTIQNLVTYKKTGVLPPLNNSVDDAIAGWKIILGRKRST